VNTTFTPQRARQEKSDFLAAAIFGSDEGQRRASTNRRDALVKGVSRVLRNRVAPKFSDTPDLNTLQNGSLL
jgi:hypothetical protein